MRGERRSRVTDPVHRATRNRTIGFLVGVVGVMGATALAYFVSLNLVIQGREDVWSSRPEIENWALPLLGATEEARQYALGAFVLLACVLVTWYAISLAALPKRLPRP